MYKAAIFLIAASCITAFIMMQVSAYGMGVGVSHYGYGGNYLNRYNDIQALRTVKSTTNGLRMSSLISLFSLFALSLLVSNSTGLLIDTGKYD